MRIHASSIVIPRAALTIWRVSLLLRAFVLASALLALSANAAGQIVEVRVAGVVGQASVSGNARPPVPLRQGDLLVPGDTLDTHGGGRVRLELSDGSVVTVQPETRLILQNYRSMSSLRELLKVFVGRVRIKINRFGSQPNPYRVNSPTASIAVRGTEFGVAVGTNGETEVVVYEGLVEVSALFGPPQRVLVEPGRGVIVRPNEPIRFFVPALDGIIAERDPDDGRDAGGNAQAGNSSSGGANSASQIGGANNTLRSAAAIYELYIDSIADSDEAPLASRFAAFSDSHLDSLENPSYATEFTVAEGRVLLLPSFGPTGNSFPEAQTLFGGGALRPVEYNLAPQISFFKPFPKFRGVIGGSAAVSRNNLQSFTLDEDVGLPHPPFPRATTGSLAALGSTTNTFFTASLVAARRLGGDGRTSIGVGVDYLTQSGQLVERRMRFDDESMRQDERLESRSRVGRTRLTIGLTRNAGTTSKLGIFYRYAHTSTEDRDRTHTLDGDPLPLEITRGAGNSSEFGARLRGALTRRLFYGVEGNVISSRSDEEVRQAVIVDSGERAWTRRTTLGFGIGYAFRPRTVLSLDVSGGFIRNTSQRREEATGNLLEDEREKNRFLSFHAAAQADVWRRMFVSGSLLSVRQAVVTDFRLFPDRFGRRLTAEGVFVPADLSRDRFTDYFSNFGAGWRFSPNFLAQYLISTDFGQTSPRHTFLLRYTFNLEGR